MRKKSQPTLLLLLGWWGLGCWISLPAQAQNPAPQQQVTVTVVNALPQPPQPVKAVAVSVMSQQVTDARGVTNELGQVLLQVSTGAALAGDLHLTVTGAGDLVIYQPAAGQLSGLTATIPVSLLPKGSLLLIKGPGQIEAMLRQDSLEIASLQKQVAALPAAAPGENQKPGLGAIVAKWALANGFSEQQVNDQVQQWAEAIQKQSDTATIEQKALAEFALRHYDAAAQLFNHAGDADKQQLNAEDAEEQKAEAEAKALKAEQQALLDKAQASLRQLLDHSRQAAGADQLNLKYHDATQTLAGAEAAAQAEYKKHPDDTGFHELWLQAILVAANALREEGEVAPATESLALLAQSTNAFAEAAQEALALSNPDQAAAAETYLANTLVDQGLRTGGDKSVAELDLAVQTYRKALAARSRAREPEGWADTQSSLATALAYESASVQGDKAVSLLNEAIEADDASLEVYTKAGTPQSWARAQMSLGVALGTEAGNVGGDEPAILLSKAAQAFEYALEVYNKTETPRNWGMAETDLGQALATEALLGRQPALFDQAVQADEKALEVYSQSATPQDWALAEANLASALTDESMAEDGEKSASLAAQSVQAFQQSLQVFTKAGLPQSWARIQGAMGYSLWLESLYARAEMVNDLLDQAVRCFQNALQIYTKANSPQQWAWQQEHLALALGDQAVRAGSEKTAALFTQASDSFARALEVYTQAEFPREWAEVEMNIVELNLRGGRYHACLDNIKMLSGNTLPSPEVAGRDTMNLACQWAAADKTAAAAAGSALLSEAPSLPKDGSWDFTGTIRVLSTSPAFASSRASWVALFTAVQNGDRAGMTAALQQLEPLLQQ